MKSYGSTVGDSALMPRLQKCRTELKSQLYLKIYIYHLNYFKGHFITLHLCEHKAHEDIFLLSSVSVVYNFRGCLPSTRNPLVNVRDFKFRLHFSVLYSKSHENGNACITILMSLAVIRGTYRVSVVWTCLLFMSSW